MTTENLDQELIDNLQAAMNAAAGNVRMRTHEITAQVNERNARRVQDARDAAIAARLVDQRHADGNAADMEEARQLARILGLDVGDQAGNDQPDPDNGQPTGQPAQLPPPAPAVPARRTLGDRMDPRGFSPVQWLLALLGLLVGLLVARFTWEDVVEDLDGFVRAVIATIWWLGIMGIGFFGGGLLGSFIDEDDDQGD